MNGDIEENDKEEDDAEESNPAEPGEDTIVDKLADEDTEVDIDVDNVGDMSVEINVEELVANIEAVNPDEAEQAREIRDKLEKIRESKNKELDSTYNFNLDDDV